MRLLSRRRGQNPVQNLWNAFWNVLTMGVLIGVLCNVVYFVAVFVNPTSSWNPFPPPTQPVVLMLPSATPTSINFLPPTWTPTATGLPTATDTPRPTATLPPSPTLFTFLTPTYTPTKPEGGYPYVMRTEQPLAVANIAHPEKGCNWMGVAGSVEDINGGPKTQLIVVLGGFLDGKLVDPSGVLYSLTGVAPQYGQAGYEFVLADQPIASQGTLWVQLLNQAGGPISERIYFDTYEDCNRNLIVISFKQVR